MSSFSCAVTNTVDTFSCQSMVAMDTSLQELPCDNDTVSPLTFINFIPTSLSVQWEVSFRGPTSVPAAPAYVTGFEVGVATSHLETGLYRASSELHCCTEYNYWEITLYSRHERCT